MFSFLNRIPIDQLSLVLHFPEEKEITFKRNLRRQFWENGRADRCYYLKKLTISPDDDELRGVTDGAIAGATATSIFHQDTLKGAIIGDWWQKEQDRTLRHVTIVLVDEQDEEKVIQLKTSRKSAKSIKRFFKEVL